MQDTSVKNKNANAVEEEAEVESLSIGSVAGLMCIAADISKVVNKNTVKIPHMTHIADKWIRSSPSSHPTVPVEVSIAADGYYENGVKPPPATRRRTADMKGLADTGCQACCMGVEQMHQLGIRINDLLAPTLNLKAANSTGMEVLGATFIRIVGKTESGSKVVIRQICYVTRGLNHLLLSRDSLEALGVISKKVSSYDRK